LAVDGLARVGPRPANEEFTIPTIKTMKLIKYLFAVAAITGALTVSAKADLVFVGAVGFDTQPNNNPDSNLAALGQFVDTTGFVLCGNSDEPGFDFGNPIANPISVMAGSYLVIHYGKGNNGSSTGGGLEFYQVVNGETSVDVPLTGTSSFGNGGISSIREFCPPGSHVPDSGTTAMLLGSALTGLGLVRRYLKR
jgi:VPDSG-CTERM motif